MHGISTSPSATTTAAATRNIFIGKSGNRPISKERIGALGDFGDTKRTPLGQAAVETACRWRPGDGWFGATSAVSGASYGRQLRADTRPSLPSPGTGRFDR